MNVAPNSVSYKLYFRAFTAVYNEFSSETAYIHFANRPEGPWSNKQALYVPSKNDKQPNYLLMERPALAKNNGKTIVISYSHPLPGFSGGRHSVGRNNVSVNPSKPKNPARHQVFRSFYESVYFTCSTTAAKASG